MIKRGARSASRTLARCTAGIEVLEARQMLSTINWTNRGNVTDNPDRFGAVFNNLQNQARAVVDTAIDYWERAIASFGYGNGTDTYNIAISMNATASTGIGANGGFNSTINNRPSNGSIGIGWITVPPSPPAPPPAPNTSAGWWIDPTPADSSEFQGTWFNGFVRGATANLGGADLFSAVLHELGHAMGLGSSTQTRAAATKTTTQDGVSPPTTPPSFLWAYNNNQSLWTEFDSGGAAGGGPANFNGPQHFAPLNTSAVVSGQTRSGAVALMNSAFPGRGIISDIEADCLRAAYNMTITPPSSFGTTYGQLDADGTLRVNTTSLANSNDVIDVRVVGSNLQLIINPTVRVAGIDPLGVITSNFPLASVQRITINTGTGNDFVRVFSNGGRPVTITDSAGTDTLEGHGAVGAYDNFVCTPTTLTATGLDVTHGLAFEALQLAPEGGTADFSLANTGSIASLQIFGSSAGETMNLRTIDAFLPTVVFAAGGNDVINIQPDFGSGLIESPVTINGSDGDDTVNVGPVDLAGTLVTQPITFNGGASADTFNLGSNNADSIRATMTFNGEGHFGGLGDRVIINDQAATYTVEYEVKPTSVRRIGFGTYDINYSQTSEIVINAGSAGDIVNRRPGVSPIVRAFGNGGNDSFTEAVVAPISSSAFNGGPGINSITFDGSNEAIGRSWQFQTDRVIYSGAINYLTTQFASVAVLAGSGNDTFSFQPALFSQAITADGGGGDDSFNTGGSRIPNLTVRGGTAGFDTLGVDDRSLLANLDSADLFPDRYVRYREPQVGDPGEFYTVNYGGFESITAWRRPAQVIVNVYGTSPDVLPTHSTVLNGDTSDSVVNIHARDAAGNLTLASNLTVNAGGTTAADNIFIHASGAQPGNYRFYNRFINSVANVDGLGAGYLTVDNLFDSITFNAGTGADTFAFDSYRSGNAVAINGGGGDDTMNLVPGGKDLGTITSIGSFNFDGGPGADTFTVTNENSASGYAYFVSNATISTIRIAGGQPQLGFGAASTEAMNVRGSQLADQYQAFFTDIGQRLEFAGLNGNDSYTFGGLIGTTLQLFRGPIFIDGGGGQDNIQLRDEETTAAHTFHIAADSVGAFAGDNLFGPGGSLRFTNIAGTLSFNGGPGAETVYVRPNATAAITVNANDPGSAPGDRLFLALAAAQNASITGTAANGSVTSSNLRPLTYTGFETGPTVDAVAPAVIDADINVDGAGFALVGGGQQSIDVNFSENVSGLISPSSLVLQNLTTGQAIPTANIAVTYAAATNTARFTFPGFANGVLPDGNYQGTVLAGLPDFFGNGLPSNVNFDFFFLNGDADRDRTAGIGDFAVLAANFNQAGAFSDGDFNYSGTVEIGDFAILATKFNTSLPAARMASMSPPTARLSEARFSEVRFSEARLEDRLIELM